MPEFHLFARPVHRPRHRRAGRLNLRAVVTRPGPGREAALRATWGVRGSLLATVLAAVVTAGWFGPAVPAAQAASAMPGATAINYGVAMLGKPYEYGAEGPHSFDCSGLTSAAFASAQVLIPRTSRDQYRLLPKLDRTKVGPGDLLFWGTDPRDWTTIYHVAVYVGGGMIVTAPRTGEVVQIKKMSTTNLMPYGARPAGLASPGILPVERGSKGHDVMALQRRLRANGHNVAVDGVYGPATLAAVKAVQAAIGQTADGNVNAPTWNHLMQHGILNAVR